MKVLFLLLTISHCAIALMAQSLSGSEHDQELFPDGVILRVRTPNGEVNLGATIQTKLDHDTYRFAVGPFNTTYVVKISNGRIGAISSPTTDEEGSRRNTSLVGLIVFEADQGASSFTRRTNVLVGIAGQRDVMGQITRRYARDGFRVELYSEVYYYMDIRDYRVFNTNIPGYRRGLVYKLNIMQEAFRERY